MKLRRSRPFCIANVRRSANATEACVCIHTSAFQHLFSYPQKLFPIVRPHPLRPAPLPGSVLKSVRDGVRPIIVADPHERDQPAVTVNPTVYDKLPIVELVMTIDVPHRIRKRNLIFAASDCLHCASVNGIGLEPADDSSYLRSRARNPLRFEPTMDCSVPIALVVGVAPELSDILITWFSIGHSNGSWCNYLLRPIVRRLLSEGEHDVEAQVLCVLAVSSWCRR
jgi:hypothetical protein